MLERPLDIYISPVSEVPTASATTGLRLSPQFHTSIVSPGACQ